MGNGAKSWVQLLACKGTLGYKVQLSYCLARKKPPEAVQKNEFIPAVNGISAGVEVNYGVARLHRTASVKKV
jgi:hypothetical protein